MNMSDEVASAVLNVSVRTAEAGVDIALKAVEKGEQIAEKAIASIAKLLATLGKKTVDRIRSTDITGIKTGEVDLKDLIQNTRKIGNTISSSENGLTERDKDFIQKKAKEYGIPVAFTQGEHKDNIYAHIRSSDLPIYKQICTEMLKNKIAERPQELGNFKVSDWEIEFLRNEFNNCDLSAQFGKMKDGQSFCMYERSDEKAILIARNEFARKTTEVKNDLMMDRDEDGFLTIKDIRTGKEVSFEKKNIPTRNELTETIKNEFGYDENKAKIACARFGEEQLSEEEKTKFFSNNPQNEFSKISTNITLKDESIITKQYTCLRVVPKTDEKPYIVYQAKNGEFAVLSPEKMTKKEMAAVLSEMLGITDKKEIDALIDKAEKITDSFSNNEQQNYSSEYKFSKNDFNMRDLETVKNMKRETADGTIMTKALPVDEINVEIDRCRKSKFKVTSISKTFETDETGNFHTSKSSQQLVLSFSDKKSAVKELTELYKQQGVPENIALIMAKETFEKAKNQPAEKILQIEEVRADETHFDKTEVDIVHGDRKETFDISDKEKAKEEIQEKFDVSAETAAAIIEKADDKISSKQTEKLEEFGFKNVDEWTKAEASNMINKIEKNNWKVPTDIIPENFKPERLSDKSANISNVAADIAKTVEKLPKTPNINIGRSR